MNSNDWLDVDSSPEAEDAMAWLQGIGGGAAAGAATGAVAGPWGALIGGAVGAGLGALSTHQQQQAQAQANRTAQHQRAAGSGRPAPRQASPARTTQPQQTSPARTTQPQQAPTPASAPQRVTSPPAATAGVTGTADVLNELRTLMPALRQLVAGVVTGAVPPTSTAGAIPAEFRAPRPAWEAAEDVAFAMQNASLDPTDAAIGHAHPEPHPAARASGTPGHPLHDLHRSVAAIAGQVRQS